MTKDEALKLALEALEIGLTLIEDFGSTEQLNAQHKAITAIYEALAQPEQKPVAWLITDEKINSLQVDSIQRLIDRARHAHMTDIKLRINGQDEWFQADWLKHLTRTTPPQRTWVGLTAAQCGVLWKVDMTPFEYYQAIEAKLKELNR